MGEECRKDDLDMAMGEDARSLDLLAARILLEAVAATWEVHWMRKILPMTSRVSGYSEKPVTQKKIELCLIIEILAWIQNTSLIYLRAVNVWGRRIARFGAMRIWWQLTIWNVPLLQEVISYAVKQYCLKIREIAYLKIVTCIIKMIYWWLCFMFWISSSWHWNLSSFCSSRLWRDRLDEEVEEERHCRA
jgi:hypothetical protein